VPATRIIGIADDRDPLALQKVCILGFHFLPPALHVALSFNERSLHVFFAFDD
jgi:hypothetical protein